MLRDQRCANGTIMHNDSWGYPGKGLTVISTSYGLKNTMDIVNNIRIKTRAAKLDIIRDYMAKGERSRIQYASKFSVSSNYYKYSIGRIWVYRH